MFLVELHALLVNSDELKGLGTNFWAYLFYPFICQQTLHWLASDLAVRKSQVAS